MSEAMDRAARRLVAALDAPKRGGDYVTVARSGEQCGETEWDRLRAHQVGLVLDALGLVAVDPALVERALRAGECDCRPEEGDAGCRSCVARVALADSILAQLEPTP